jgi:hypothetical protein
MIVLLKLKFEFFSIAKDNKLRLQVNVPTRCYETNPGWMFADLFVALTISNQSVFDFWIYCHERMQKMCFG